MGDRGKARVTSIDVSARSGEYNADHGLVLGVGGLQLASPIKAPCKSAPEPPNLLKTRERNKEDENETGFRSIIRRRGATVPLSTLLPFALVAVIGIVVFYAAYRAGA